MIIKLDEADVSAPVLKVDPKSLIRYESDLFGWSLEQASLLKDGRFAELDLINLADEIADVAGQQFDKLESALRVLLHHLLKWDYQPSLRSRSWANTIKEQRRQVEKVLRKSPSLKSAFEEALADAYESAKNDASSETDIDIERFPAVCPYSRDEFMTREITWPTAGQSAR